MLAWPCFIVTTRSLTTALTLIGFATGCSGVLADGGPVDGVGGGDSSSAGGSVASGGSDAGSGGGTGPGGGAPCGTADARAVFLQSCAAGLCHDASAPAAELDLTVFDPGAAYSGVLGKLCTDALLLDPGSPETSLLFTKVSDAVPSCGDRMPIGGVLDGASLDCLASWISTLGSEPPSCETCGGVTCTDVLVDTENCGTCGTACTQGQICEAGVCTGCPVGETACGTTCVDVLISIDHCGTCGTSCGAGQTCADGECVCAAGVSVSFAQDVAPLLAAGCSDMGCHGGAMPKEGLDLRQAASYADLVGVTSSQCNDGRLLVDPGAPESSYLLQKMLGVELCSGTLMPKANSPWPEADLATISAWICAGALDN